MFVCRSVARSSCGLSGRDIGVILSARILRGLRCWLVAFKLNAVFGVSCRGGRRKQVSLGCEIYVSGFLLYLLPVSA